MLLGLFCTLSMLAVRRFFLGLSSNHWLRVKAKVISTGVDSRNNSDNETWFNPKIRYSYRLATGRTYYSTRMSYKLLSSEDYMEAFQYIEGLKPGSELYVYINPGNNRQSVVVKGVNVRNVVEIVFYLIFVGLTLNGLHIHYAAVTQ